MCQATSVKVAVQGCCHGSLTSIYDSLDKAVELLIICGDFQALRHTTDFCTISVPAKYLQMGDFHHYYSGERLAPVMTVFVGGNHECSLYMTELQYGGWAAPNIYYMGKFGSVWFRGLQIGGWSGIYNDNSFARNIVGDYPLPYNPSTLRLVYHHTPKTFLKMCLLNRFLDIAVSHDWPQGIEQYGNTQRLIKQKPFFKNEIDNNLLGSPLNMYLLQSLWPLYWFSAHLHIGFEAVIDGGRERDLGITPENGTSPYSHQSQYSKSSSGPTSADKADENVIKSDQKELILDMDDSEEDNALPRKTQGPLSDGKSCVTENVNMNAPTSSANNGHKPKVETLGSAETPNGETASNTQDTGLHEISLDMDEDYNDKTHDTRVLSSKPLYEYEADSVERGSTLFNTIPADSTSTPKGPDSRSTRFHAFDKCGRNRHLLETMDIPVKPENLTHPSRADSLLHHSVRAIAINKVVETYMDTHRSAFEGLDMAAVAKNPSKLTLVNELRPLVNREIRALQHQHDLSTFVIDCQSFARVCPSSQDLNVPLQWWPNPQTNTYCEKFGIKPPNLESNSKSCASALLHTQRETRSRTFGAGQGKRFGNNTTPQKSKSHKKPRNASP